jgi:rare lipoprotein A
MPEFGVADILDDTTPGLRGLASFYSYGFHGRRTSTGERFDARQFTAASNHFPLGTLVAVSRADNGRCAIVKVNDRMHAKHRRRIIDVARGVAEYLEMLRAGVVMVRVAAVAGQPHIGPGGAECRAAFEPVAAPACETCGEPENKPETEGAPQGL